MVFVLYKEDLGSGRLEVLIQTGFACHNHI